jgi:predicted membrane protein
MWAVFLLASLSVAIVALVIVYIGHRVIMQIEKERNQKLKTNKNKTKRGNKK